MSVPDKPTLFLYHSTSFGSARIGAMRASVRQFMPPTSVFYGTPRVDFHERHAKEPDDLGAARLRPALTSLLHDAATARGLDGILALGSLRELGHTREAVFAALARALGSPMLHTVILHADDPSLAYVAVQQGHAIPAWMMRIVRDAAQLRDERPPETAPGRRVYPKEVSTRAVALLRGGHALRGIASQFDEDGILTVYGKRWSAKGVRDLLIDTLGQQDYDRALQSRTLLSSAARRRAEGVEDTSWGGIATAGRPADDLAPLVGEPDVEGGDEPLP